MVKQTNKGQIYKMSSCQMADIFFFGVCVAVETKLWLFVALLEPVLHTVIQKGHFRVPKKLSLLKQGLAQTLSSENANNNY